MNSLLKVRGPRRNAREPEDAATAVDRKIEKLSRLFLVLFIVTAALLSYWQIVDAGSLVNRAENPRLYYSRLAIRRGAFYDRNGAVLARTTFSGSGPNAQPTRTYPTASLGALLGYDSAQYGNAGLEDVYNAYLNGAAPSQPLDNTLNRLLHQPIIGDDVHLTIDARIQKIVATEFGAGRGACVVADPRTGAIEALYSQPSIDPNLVDDQGYWDSTLKRTDSPFVDRALRAAYAPGSTFKTITLAAAYDTGLLDTSTVLQGQQATGPLFVDGYLLRSAINNLPNGVASVSTVDAFKYSDNIAFATIGISLTQPTLLDYAARFGFGAAIPFDLPVTRSQMTTHPDTFSRLDLAESAFGQAEVLATPLQMLMAAEAVANGGQEMTPYVVSAVTAPNGEILTQNNPSVFSTPISAATAAKMTQAMTAVVESPGGSGFEAKVPSVPVAGKTGTAETPGGAPHAWFIGFAPADHPRLAIVVFKENGGEGYAQAAPIAGRILAQALPLTK